MQAMSDRHFPALDDLIRDIEAKTATRPELPQMLAQLIPMALARDADPYILLGVLIEGVVHTLASSIPPEARAAVAKDVLRLLCERLRARGLP